MLRRLSRILLILSLSAAISAACAPAVVPPGQVAPTPAATQPQPSLPPEQPAPRPGKPVMVDTPASGELGGAVTVSPELMKILEADLAERLGSIPADLQVIRSEAVVWNDGSLGCPKPGVFYTQMVVDGFWVVLQSDETTYDYRIGNLESKPVLCEASLPAGS